MNELTYHNYIKYLQENIEHFQETNLSPDEMHYINLIKKYLSDTPNLPQYILDMPLLPSKEHDQATLSIIAKINKTNSFSEHLVKSFKTFFYKVKQMLTINDLSFRDATLIGVAISIVILFIISLALILPQTSDLLMGTAGMNDSQSSDIALSLNTKIIGAIILLIVVVLSIFKRKK